MAKLETQKGLYSQLFRSASLTAILCSAAPAFAQARDQAPPTTATQGAEQDEPESTEDIVVSGVRRSLQESLALKREAINFVDAVVAEDIGKFPDANLAEALQRVPGVTITRNRGEGKNISVRGLGGDYNVTTLNGRRLATENTGREFNYDVIASELVGGLEVFKSPLAELPEGGIGSVVNIRTRRPLDIGKFKIAASGKAEYESRTGKTSPSASFLISDTFADGRFGILLSATYSRKTLRQDTFIGEGFYNANDPNGDYVAVPYDANHDGTISADANGDAKPGQGSEYFESSVPGYVRYSIAQDTRTRIGGNLSLQWQPNDHINVTLDGVYSRYRTNGTDYQISFVNWDESWTPGVPQVDEVRKGQDGLVNYIKVGGQPVAELLNASTPRRAATYQVGLNVAGKGDLFSWDLDVAHSRAKDQNGGDNRYVVARAVLDSYVIDATQGNLLPSMTLSPGLTQNTPFGAHYSYNYGTGITDSITEIRLGGKLTPHGFLDALHFGIGYSAQTKARQTFASANPSAFSNGGQYLTRGGYGFDPSLVQTFGSLRLFRLPAEVFQKPGFDNFLQGEPGTAPLPWPSFNYDALYAYYLKVNPDAAKALIAPTYSPTASYRVTEKLMNGYARATLRGRLFAMPFILDLGLRASLTDTASAGSSRTLDDYVPGQTPKIMPVMVKGSYADILPSANFRLNLTDSLILRASAAKVMTRAPLDDLSPYQAIDLVNHRITRSNPDLDPFRADQLDAALEWYFGKIGILSAAFYWKDIKSFTTQDIHPETIGGIVWQVEQPVTSGGGGKIKGFEVSYQQSFDKWLPHALRGFGMQFNYTYTTSSFGDPTLRGLPFTGMSKHSFNLVGFYEANNVSLRVAYDKRGKYVANPDGWGGAEWVAGYGQLDASASYNITRNVAIVAEATNLTNARYYQYIRTPGQVSYLAHFGRQISLGARLGF